MTITDDECTRGRLHSVRDLGAAVRDARQDARAVGIDIADDWCRDQMHDLGETRYENVTDTLFGAICDRVDALAEAEA